MSALIVEKMADYERQLDAFLKQYPVAEQAERQLGIRKTHLVALAGLLLVSSVLSLFFPGFLLAVITLCYPIYASAQAADGHDKAEDVHWLAYWILYAKVHVGLDLVLYPFILKAFLSKDLYAILKAALLVYLYAPQTRGATLIWLKAGKPMLHFINSTCPGLNKSASASSYASQLQQNTNNNKKRLDVAKALNEMRNRSSSKEASGDER